MQTSKEQSLKATYAAMDSSEIERRLASGQLTLVATKIALTELHGRPAEQIQAETAAVANSADVDDSADTDNSADVDKSAEVAGGRAAKSKPGLVMLALAAFALFYFWSIFPRTGLRFSLHTEHRRQDKRD